MFVLVSWVVLSVQHDTSNTRHINVALAEGGAALVSDQRRVSHLD